MCVSGLGPGESWSELSVSELSLVGEVLLVSVVLVSDWGNFDFLGFFVLCVLEGAQKGDWSLRIALWERGLVAKGRGECGNFSNLF